MHWDCDNGACVEIHLHTDSASMNMRMGHQFLLEISNKYTLYVWESVFDNVW